MAALPTQTKVSKKALLVFIAEMEAAGWITFTNDYSTNGAPSKEFLFKNKDGSVSAPRTACTISGHGSYIMSWPQ